MATAFNWATRKSAYWSTIRPLRPSDSLKTSPEVARLFPDYHAVEMQSYRRTKVFPIMHLVAMRRDTYERNPFIARSCDG